MGTSIRSKAHNPDQKDMFDAVLVDITALRTAIMAITAKLDLDGGVTDVNYAATCNPAAPTTVA